MEHLALTTLGLSSVFSHSYVPVGAIPGSNVVQGLTSGETVPQDHFVIYKRKFFQVVNFTIKILECAAKQNKYVRKELFGGQIVA